MHEEHPMPIKACDLTLLEKIVLVEGTDFWKTNPIYRVQIPSIFLTDGPHGVRKADFSNQNAGNLSTSKPATAFPTAATSACSWNPKLLYSMGQAMGKECLHHGVSVLLGPGINIKKNPTCGRNFEYFSEDPLLTGRLGIELVRGVQSQGVGTSVKHFAVNNYENYRFSGNSILDDRALYDIYLKAFEMVIKQAEPETVMCSYNQINGEFASQNKHLLTDVLRNKWGFTGAVISDWGAVVDKAKALEAGLDLEMPGSSAHNREHLYNQVKNGTCSLSALDQAVNRILKLVASKQNLPFGMEVDFDKNAELALALAEESAVLLKNENNALPLDKKKKYCIIGDLFTHMRYQGAGSSTISPTKLITPINAFDAHHLDYVFARGYDRISNSSDPLLLDEALKLTQSFDEVIVFVGLPDLYEMEGFDREHMHLPQNQIDLIYELTKKNKKIHIVLFGGSPVELPFIDQIDSLLNMYLPGQMGGEATYRLLFGEVNPSGRLAETWPLHYQDVPFNKQYSQSIQELYRESIYVGYRYYQSFDKPVRFPFGFGLSYTHFTYDSMAVHQAGDKIQVSVTLTNNGSVFGQEVIQLYLSKKNGLTYRPKYELMTFQKVALQPNQSQIIELSIDIEQFKYYEIKEKRLVLEDGDYLICLGRHVGDIIFEKTIRVQGENYQTLEVEGYRHFNPDTSSLDDFERLLKQKVPLPPPAKPYSLESPIHSYQSFFGKILLKALISGAKKQYKKALKMADSPQKEGLIKDAIFLMKLLPNNSARSLSMSSGGQLPYHIAQGFVELANGHLFRAIRAMTKKPKKMIESSIEKEPN